MIRPSTQNVPACRVCHGSRVVKSAGGRVRPCSACNGTGKQGGGYITK